MEQEFSSTSFPYASIRLVAARRMDPRLRGDDSGRGDHNEGANRFDDNKENFPPS